MSATLFTLAQAAAWLPGARVVEMKTGHDPMVSDPQGLTRLLLDCSR